MPRSTAPSAKITWGEVYRKRTQRLDPDEQDLKGV